MGKEMTADKSAVMPLRYLPPCSGCSGEFFFARRTSKIHSSYKQFVETNKTLEKSPFFIRNICVFLEFMKKILLPTPGYPPHINIEAGNISCLVGGATVKFCEGARKSCGDGILNFCFLLLSKD
jgi:hypothetical protein